MSINELGELTTERSVSSETDRSAIFGALREAICASPDDDGPRLVYADACEDERGELIVTQCARAAGDARAELAARETELLALHGERWFEPLGAFSEAVVHRGFVEHIALPVGPLSDAFAQEPVRHLTLTGDPNELRYLMSTMPANMLCMLQRRELGRLDRLDLPAGVNRDCLQMVGRASVLSKLRAMHVPNAQFDDHAFAGFLRDNLLAALEELAVGCTSSSYRRDALGASLARIAFPRLRKLALHWYGIARAGLLALTDSPAFARLDALDLACTAIDEPTIISALLAKTHLRSLRLSFTGFLRPHAKMLADAPGTATLVQLDLSDTNVEDYVDVLAAAHLPALRDLDLGCARGHAKSPQFGELAALADAPWFSQLETLRLDGRAVGDAGLAQLLARLPALRTLTVANCDLTNDAIPALVARPALEILDSGAEDRLRPGPELPVRAREAPPTRIRARCLTRPLWPVR